MTLTPDQRRAKAAEAQQIEVTLHVGKNGVTPATGDELKLQLKKRKLVKVRLLKASTETGDTSDQARQLAELSGGELVETRGHTAVYWRH